MTAGGFQVAPGELRTEADDRMGEIGQRLGQLAGDYEAGEEAHARAIRGAAGEVFRSAEVGGA